MLTATYSLVAMSVEHANVRAGLHAFHDLVQTSFAPESSLSAGQVDFACLAMQRLYNAFGCRKVELFLVPAVRKLAHVADRLLAELDHLRRTAAQAMGAILERVRSVPVETPAEVARFCASADNFCSALLARLEREERDLFAIARTALTVEAWFDIAHALIAAENKTTVRPPDRDEDEHMHRPPPLAHAESNYARGVAG